MKNSIEYFAAVALAVMGPLGAISCCKQQKKIDVEVTTSDQGDGLKAIAPEKFFRILEGTWMSEDGMVIMKWRQSTISFQVEDHAPIAQRELDGMRVEVSDSLVFRREDKVYSICWNAENPQRLDLISRFLGKNELDVLSFRRRAD